MGFYDSMISNSIFKFEFFLKFHCWGMGFQWEIMDFVVIHRDFTWGILGNPEWELPGESDTAMEDEPMDHGFSMLSWITRGVRDVWGC